MGETPDQIRDEIEQTRARMSDTAEAIGYKADVKSRMKESVAEKKDAVVGTISDGRDAVVGTADSLVSRVGGIVPDSQEVKEGAARVGVTENPLGLASPASPPDSCRDTAPQDEGGEQDDRPGLRPGDRQGQGGRTGNLRTRKGRRPGRPRGRRRHRAERGGEEVEDRSASLQEKAQELGQNA